MYSRITTSPALWGPAMTSRRPRLLRALPATSKSSAMRGRRPSRDAFRLARPLAVPRNPSGGDRSRQRVAEGPPIQASAWNGYAGAHSAPCEQRLSGPLDF